MRKFFLRFFENRAPGLLTDAQTVRTHYSKHAYMQNHALKILRITKYVNLTLLSILVDDDKE